MLVRRLLSVKSMLEGFIVMSCIGASSFGLGYVDISLRCAGRRDTGLQDLKCLG